MTETSFRPILERLLAETCASRTTLRLAGPRQSFEVSAEALAPGVPSIAADEAIDVHGSATFRFVARTRTILVQRDILDDELRAPPELVERYGARAQMLAPVIVNGDLEGVISVHYVSGPRDWRKADVSALENAIVAVVRALERRK